MKKLFHYADCYIQESDWRDLALVKICLCAAGILFGCAIPVEKRRRVLLGAGVAFVATYIPIMTKFGRIVLEKGHTNG